MKGREQLRLVLLDIISVLFDVSLSAEDCQLTSPQKHTHTHTHTHTHKLPLSPCRTAASWNRFCSKKVHTKSVKFNQ